MATNLAALRERVELQLSDVSNARYSTNAIDEAITQALDAYSDRLPLRVITTLNVTSAGRELDISSLTYRTVEHVWWDYDASDPDYPPHWRTFDVWPGDVLFITDPEEPAAGDVVRVWYTTGHTLEDLNGAASTTLPDQDASLVAQGAAALAALARRATVSEDVNDNEWAPRNLKDWAEARLADFYQRLDRRAAQLAAQAGGIAPGPELDRWDGANVW